MTGEVNINFDIHDSEIDALSRGPLAWARGQAGMTRNIDAFTRELHDRVYKCGLLSEVKVYDTNQGDTYGFTIEINGRVAGNFFDHDRQVHEVQNNLLELPGEGGVIDTKAAIREFERQRRENGRKKH